MMKITLALKQWDNDNGQIAMLHAVQQSPWIRPFLLQLQEKTGVIFNLPQIDR